MKVVGLSGGSGSGKSELSRILSSYGIPVINADEVYAELVSGDSDCLRELISTFGEEIASSDGSLNRAALASLVFSGEGAAERRARLNSITHRYVLREIRSELSCLSDSGCELAAVDVPLLFESGFDRECDLTVAVIADREVRISRICSRDGLDRISAERRINSQLSAEELSSRVDYVVYNNGGIDDLKLEAERLLSVIKNM